jgi:hypothetical protein
MICGRLLVFWGALLVSGVVAASAQDASKLSTDVKIDVRDYCDPTSFNAAIGDGTCDRSTADGFITFDGFVAELGADQSVGAWRYAPNQISVAENATLHVNNLGGETHTFTQVKDFGGGFVGFLNTASGNPVPAPECAQIVNGNLVPQPPSADNIFLGPGATATVSLDHELNAKYQCCIHPWMRLTITPHDTHHTEVH